MKYKCVVYSNSSPRREYEVEYTSAGRAAMCFGFREAGEIVEIRRKRTDQLLSKVMWMQNYGSYGDYVQISIPKGGKYD